MDERSSWSGSFTELATFDAASDLAKKKKRLQKLEDHTAKWGTKESNAAMAAKVKRSALDVNSIKPELEGLRNSEHRLSRILSNLGSPLAGSSKKKGRRMQRKSIIDIRKNEKLLQVRRTKKTKQRLPPPIERASSAYTPPFTTLPPLLVLLRRCF